MIQAREYVDDRGRSPCGPRFDDLDAGTAVRVRTVLAGLEAGNLSNVRSVGGGVLECRINVGRGCRVCFGRDGDTLIVLLGGGARARQHRDIEDARELWQEHRHRKQHDELTLLITEEQAFGLSRLLGAVFRESWREKFWRKAS